MAAAITKEYLERQLHNFEDVVLDNKYIQGIKVNGTEVTPGADHKVDITVSSGGAYTPGNGIDISNNTISAVAKTDGGLAVDATGIYVVFEDTNIDFSNWSNYSV